MSREESVAHLVLQWENLRLQGKIVDVADLCQGAPELLTDVRRQVKDLESMNNRLATQGDTGGFGGAADDTIDSSPHEFVGTRFEFKILRSHAQGGLGRIYVAEDTQLKRRVALKVIQSAFDGDELRRRRFVREAELTSRLEHPGVVPVYSMGVDESGRPCYSMRFIAGETLQQEITAFHASATLPYRDSLRSLRKLLNSLVAVCRTVAFAHDHGVIHRDIKPSNIIIGRYGETLLIDWGLAKQLDDTPSESGDTVVLSKQEWCPQAPTPMTHDKTPDPLTQHDSILGTPGYLSPEQATSSQKTNALSDVWSLGATLFTILTGQAPIQSKDVGAMLMDARAGAFPRPRKLRPDIPRALEAVCLKAMSVEPACRYETAQAMATDVELWLAGEPVGAFPERWLSRGRRWAYRNRTLVSSLTAAMIMATIGLSILLVRSADANRRLQESNAKESAARDLALRNETLAEGQAELALSTLQAVIRELQVQLKNIPAVHEVRKSMLNRALDGLKNVATSLDRQPEINHNLLRAHLDLGAIFFEIGDEQGSDRTTAAQKEFERAMKIASRLGENPSDWEAIRHLATTHRWLGKVNERLSTLAAAKDSYQQAFDIRNRVVRSHAATEADHRLLAVALDDLGNVATDEGQLEIAGGHYEEALRIREELVARGSTDAEVIRDVQVSHDKLGTLALRTSRINDAIAHFQKGLDISDQRHTVSPNDTQAFRDLAYANRQLGYGLSRAGRFADAEKAYAESLRICNSLFQADPVNLATIRDLMQIQQKMGDLMLKLNKSQSAHEHFQQMFVHCERLLQADPHNQTALGDFKVACGKRADILEIEGNYTAAMEFRIRSVELSRQIAALDPLNPRSQETVAISLSKLAVSLLELQRPAEAAPLLDEAVEIYRSIWQSKKTDKTAWRTFLVIQLQLGVALKQTEHFDEARRLYADAQKMAEAVVAEDEANAAVRLDLINIYHTQGILEAHCHQVPAAKAAFEKALEIVSQLEKNSLLVGDDLTWRPTLLDALKDLETSSK